MMRKRDDPVKISSGLRLVYATNNALIDQLHALAAAPDHEFNDGLVQFVAGVEDDFRWEEILMEEIDFPGIQSHREQHVRVLNALHRVVREAMQGNCTAARKMIGLIPQWFLFHLLTMDTTLAVAIDSVGLQSIESPIDHHCREPDTERLLSRFDVRSDICPDARY